MGRRCPALLARSLTLAQHGTLKDILQQQQQQQQPPSQSSSSSESSFLYVLQHEYSVLAPPRPNTPHAPAFIASDEATTCSLLGLREPETGVVGLAHLDSGKAVGDLVAMERRVWEEVERLQPPPPPSALGGGTTGRGPRALDVYIVGGYDAHGAGGELLTAQVLSHFAAASSDPAVAYRLQVALVSGPTPPRCTPRASPRRAAAPSASASARAGRSRARSLGR